MPEPSWLATSGLSGKNSKLSHKMEMSSVFYDCESRLFLSGSSFG